MHLTALPTSWLVSTPSATALSLTIRSFAGDAGTLVGCAVLLGIWLLAFRCRLQAYREVLQRLDRQQSFGEIHSRVSGAPSR
jgi:hypothetical protein